MLAEHPPSFDLGRPLQTLDVPGFLLREALYDPSLEIAAHPHPWATLCLAVEGGYQEDWGGTRVRCGPASLVFHPPGEAYEIARLIARAFTLAATPAPGLDARNGGGDAVGRGRSAA